MGRRTKKRPHILLIDDQPTPEGLALSLDDVELTIRLPEDVTVDDLERADLVLVDLLLRAWDERDAVEAVSRKPIDGLSVIFTLKSHLVDKTGETRLPCRLCAMSLLTGQPQQLVQSSYEGRLHSIARAHNLEWVFDKRKLDSSQISSLARAITETRENWTQYDLKRPMHFLAKLLRLPMNQDWVRAAFQSIEDCHPPVHGFTGDADCIAIIRWLLHRILPYPCFLWSETKVSWRLGLSPKSFRQSRLKHDSDWKMLNQVKYNGILHDFEGDRWWGSGVNALLWKATGGKSWDPGAVREVIRGWTSSKIDFTSSPDDVICVDESGRPQEDLCRVGSAIEIQPDDWPPYADPAWANLESVKDNEILRALVIQTDRSRLD